MTLRQRVSGSIAWAGWMLVVLGIVPSVESRRASNGLGLDEGYLVGVFFCGLADPKDAENNEPGFMLNMLTVPSRSASRMAARKSTPLRFPLTVTKVTNLVQGISLFHTVKTRR